MGKVTINGNTFEVPDGESVSVSGDGIVIINGERIESEETASKINIVFEGVVGKVNIEKCDAAYFKKGILGDVSVKGDASFGEGTIKGDLKANNINGNVEANNVKCSNVYGHVTAQNDVRCDNVMGSVTSYRGSVECNNVMGDVQSRR